MLAIEDSQGLCFPTYDGNGNVSEYVAGAGQISAHYEYSPFGAVTLESGTKADKFNFRFSTKYTDIESGLNYYGYRYYNPEDGAWLSRDPIEEQGGLNLYGFVGNNVVNNWDLLGNATHTTTVTNGAYSIELELVVNHKFNVKKVTGISECPTRELGGYTSWENDSDLSFGSVTAGVIINGKNWSVRTGATVSMSANGSSFFSRLWNYKINVSAYFNMDYNYQQLFAESGGVVCACVTGESTSSVTATVTSHQGRVITIGGGGLAIIVLAPKILAVLSTWGVAEIAGVGLAAASA